MMKRGPIEVIGESNKVVECPKFTQSVSFLKCIGEEKKYGLLEVKGKGNCVQLDGCAFVNVHVDSIMSSLEISNSRKLNITARAGALVSLIVIDSSEGVEVNLSKETIENLDFQIVTAKSSAMNVHFPCNSETVKRKIPENFIHKFDLANGCKINSTVSESPLESHKSKDSVAPLKCVGAKGKYENLEVKEKGKSARVDGCAFANVLVDPSVSVLEVSNSKKSYVTVKEGAVMSLIIVENSDGVQMKINKETVANPKFQIVTAKYSELNVDFEYNGEDTELPIPEQFVHKFDKDNGFKLVSVVSDLYRS